MSLLSRISLTVILARIEKHFVDTELGTFNLEVYIKELFQQERVKLKIKLK